MVFVVAIVLAILAPIVARLVQLAVSRQREYLADASGVELTRNPVGLERALAKITLDTEPLEVANRATQHLYFENPIKAATGRSSNLFSTHPAALDRINRLRELNGQPAVSDPVQVLDPGDASLAGGRGGLAPALTPGGTYRRAARAATGIGRPDGRGSPADRRSLPHDSARMVSCAAPTGPRGGLDRAEIAQLVEHATENRGVASSNLALGTITRSASSGSGSVGRASPCQGEGRGFESRLPLHSSPVPMTTSGPAAPSSSGRTADFGSVSRGSNPRGAANLTDLIPGGARRTPATWRRGLTRGSAKPLFIGSNPIVASTDRSNALGTARGVLLSARRAARLWFRHAAHPLASSLAHPCEGGWA